MRVPGVDGSATLREGAIVIENEVRAWPAGQGWKVSPDPLFRIGAADGQEAYLFMDVVEFVGRPDGGVAVLDGRSANLRFFDATGQHVRTVGRRGQGPGEFGFPDMLLALGDSLVVWDPMQGRATVFAPGGDYARDFSFAAYLAEYGPVQPVGYATNGTLVFVDRPSEDQGPGEVEENWSTARLILVPTGDTDRGHVVRVPWTQCDRTSARSSPCSFLDFGFGASAHIELDEDRVVYARSDRNVFLFMDLEGVVTTVIRGAEWNSEVTEAMKRDYLESLPDYALVGRVRSAAEWPFADALPAFSSFQVDPAGYLWTREYRWDEFIPGVASANSRTSPVPWTVYTPDGTLLGEVVLPAGWVSEIGDDYVLTVHTDALGVVQLSKYALVKP